jgi:hypothetical protein
MTRGRWERPRGRRAGAIVLVLLLLIPLIGVQAPAEDSSASLTIAGMILPPTGLAADFTAEPVSGPGPLTVQFTDLSTGDPAAWAWDVNGDSSVESIAENPAFTYHRAGSFPVILKVTKDTLSSTKTKPDYITVSEPGARARIRTLEAYVNAMPARGLVKWFLLIHLGITERLLSRGNHRAAAAQMMAFLRQATLFERFDLINPEDGAYLREEGRVILSLIEE